LLGRDGPPNNNEREGGEPSPAGGSARTRGSRSRLYGHQGPKTGRTTSTRNARFRARRSGFRASWLPSQHRGHGAGRHIAGLASTSGCWLPSRIEERRPGLSQMKSEDRFCCLRIGFRLTPGGAHAYVLSLRGLPTVTAAKLGAMACGPPRPVYGGARAKGCGPDRRALSGPTWTVVRAPLGAHEPARNDSETCKLHQASRRGPSFTLVAAFDMSPARSAHGWRDAARIKSVPPFFGTEAREGINTSKTDCN